jgi:acetyltransferase-like isoleucine patch superfamily enzyme
MVTWKKSGRNPLARIRRNVRLRRLNMMPGVTIAASTYIAPSAMIQTDPDGGSFGGGIRISDRVVLSDGVILATYGGMIEIEANVYVGPYCVVYGHGGTIIGRNTMIGAHTVIVPANHGFMRTDVPMNAQPLTKKGITIGQDVWIGAGCRILDGVRIGSGAVVGAGSVVTSTIEAYSMALGSPARSVRSRMAELKPSLRPEIDSAVIKSGRSQS